MQPHRKSQRISKLDSNQTSENHTSDMGIPPSRSGDPSSVVSPQQKRISHTLGVKPQSVKPSGKKPTHASSSGGVKPRYVKPSGKKPTHASSSSGFTTPQKKAHDSPSLEIKATPKITEKVTARASSSVDTPADERCSRSATVNFGYQTTTKSNSTRFGYQEKSDTTTFGNQKRRLTHNTCFGNQKKGSFENHSEVTQTNKRRNSRMHTSSFESSSSAMKMTERKITAIKNINPMISNMSIKGRCISVWHSHKLNEPHDPYSLDCVFQDEESNRIQISVKREFMFKFEPLLREGQCCIISNFGVAENSGRLPLLPNQWKISFYKGTEVTRIEQIDENFSGFVNEPLERILDTNNEYHDHDCVDVIGTVVAIGKIVSVNGYGCSKIRRTIVIENAESLRIECTFWDKWATMWNEYADKLDEVDHLDLIIMLAKVKYWNGKPVIHNALFGTMIFINKDYPEFRAFRNSYETQNGYDANEFKIQEHNQDMHVVTPAEFMQGSVKSMVGTIRNIEPDTHCVVYATVHSIKYESGWVYTGCKACNTKVNAVPTKGASSSRNQKQLWQCKKHGETYAVVSRFKIIIRIFDETGSAQVVIFDNNVYKMTKLSAWEIMKEQGMDTDEYFPEDLNQIIGKQYLFKVKYSESDHNNNHHIYRAEKVSEDSETINYFKNGFLDDEIEDEDYTNDSVEVNEAVEDDDDEVTTPSVKVNENLEDENQEPSIEKNGEFHNEDTENAITCNDILPTNYEASESEKQRDYVFIDLSDYETEDEREDSNTANKIVTVKMEKDP